ncbi:MAG: cytochrome c oxidase subunit II [Methanobacteriota archaeon]
MLRRRAFVPLVLAVALAAVATPAAAAWFTDPVTETARTIDDLYDLVFWMAIVVGVLVEGVLLFVVWRYRANGGAGRRTKEHERGNTPLEIAWTIPPVIILLAIGVLSYEALVEIENPPAGERIEVDVNAGQWFWEFSYPDGTSSFNELRVEEDRIVVMDLQSQDVLHAVFIREFAGKVDVVPNGGNRYWFLAETPGEYVLQCAEYCGAGHGEMRATVVVFAKGTQAKPYGEAAAGPGTGGAGTIEGAVQVEASDGGGRFFFRPTTVEVAAGEVTFQIRNTGGAPHNFHIGSGVEARAPDRGLIAPGKDATVTVTLTAGEYDFWCDPHRGAGMTGKIVVS